MALPQARADKRQRFDRSPRALALQAMRQPERAAPEKPVQAYRPPINDIRFQLGARCGGERRSCGAQGRRRWEGGGRAEARDEDRAAEGWRREGA